MVVSPSPLGTDVFMGAFGMAVVDLSVVGLDDNVTGDDKSGGGFGISDVPFFVLSCVMFVIAVVFS